MRIAINGFGRIGRAAFKIAQEMKGVTIVAINDLTDPETLAHLLRYDSNYGAYNKSVAVRNQKLVVGANETIVLAEKDPSLLPWKKLNIDAVLECTGRFTDEAGASLHLKAGAKRVIISAPAKGGNVQTFVLGVNADKLDASRTVISNASCTTNCITPVVEVVHRKFGIAKATMTTIHSYTQDQVLQDSPHKDLRRARAAALNIVPTTTGAAIATTETIPQLKGKFDGLSIRVPTPVVSLSDMTFVLQKKTTVEEVNTALESASKEKRYKGILAVTKEPLVSSDFIGNTHSSIVDLALTSVIEGDLVKVIAWYDNEWGYSCRLVEMAVAVGKTL